MSVQGSPGRVRCRVEDLTTGDFGRGIGYNVACDALCDIMNIIVEKSRYMHQNVNTLGKLKDSGWVSKSVKDELRDNLILKLRDRENLFPGIYGYDKTVIPQVIHSILSRHDLILLGLRGRSEERRVGKERKTRNGTGPRKKKETERYEAQ